MKHVALIVEPSAAKRRQIARMIASTEFFEQIIHSETAQQSAEVLQQQPVDILCCAFPHRPSQLVPLIDRLREKDEWHDIPLLLFTLDDRSNDRVGALELGASDCLPLTLSARQAAVQIGWHLKNRQRIAQLLRSEADLTRRAITDSLTGLFNRGYFDADLEQKISLSQRTGRPLTLLLADLDHFKQVNDTYGHQAGDHALRCFARLLKQSARKSDVLCRYGGEEFAVILPECDGKQAFQAAERLREKVAAYDFGFHLTVSIGLAATGQPCRHSSAVLLEQADSALYSAKQKGRNRSEMFPLVPGQILSDQFGGRYDTRYPKVSLPQALRRSLAVLRRAARYSFG